jgi:hypothetical protein
MNWIQAIETRYRLRQEPILVLRITGNMGGLVRLSLPPLCAVMGGVGDLWETPDTHFAYGLVSMYSQC